MDNKYKIFKERYNAVLELVDNNDDVVLNIYKNAIDKILERGLSAMPDYEKERHMSYFSTLDQFKLDFSGYKLEFIDLDSTCYLDIEKNNPYFHIAVSIQELNDDNYTYLNLLTISVRNMKEIEPKLHLEYFQDENGNLTLISSNYNEDKNAINFDYTVDIMFENNKYYLLIKKWHRGVELSCNQVEITEEEVWDCIDASQEDIDEEDDEEIDYLDENFNEIDF